MFSADQKCDNFGLLLIMFTNKLQKNNNKQVQSFNLFHFKFKVISLKQTKAGKIYQILYFHVFKLHSYLLMFANKIWKIELMNEL